MSQRETIKRYLIIVSKLTARPSSWVEIEEHLNKESEFYSYNFNISKRTFQRDIDDISFLFNIDIEYNKSRKVYEIKDNSNKGITQKMIEAFETLDALNLSTKVSKFIHFEKRKPQGTANLKDLICAIKETKQVQFEYKKFWQDETSTRQVEPYTLKEFKQRWYLIAKDKGDNEIKSFGLDRISELISQNIKFTYPQDFDIEKYYFHCFGIISPNADKPEEIILSFTAYQGKYIKSFPLHASQEILIDTEEEFRIKLMLYITHDLFMELLSYGQNIKILAPPSLIDKYKATIAQIQKKY